MSNEGKIVQVIGPVIDADFSDAERIPAIYNALTVEYELNGSPTKLTLEVQQHLGDGWVRAVAMSTTEGLKRGVKLTDTGSPIMVPVGEGPSQSSCCKSAAGYGFAPVLANLPVSTGT